MAARKGIKAKIVAWLRENPTAEVSTREIERMYVEHGGAVNGEGNPKYLQGRVARDTMKRLMAELPVTLVTKSKKRDNCTWQFSQVKSDQIELDRMNRKNAWKVRLVQGGPGQGQAQYVVKAPMQLNLGSQVNVNMQVAGWTIRKPVAP